MSINQLHSFDDVVIQDNNESKLPEFNGDGSDTNEMLDYMFLVLARSFCSEAAFKGGYLLSNLLKEFNGVEFSRKTTDIDFSIMNEKRYADVKVILKSIAESFLAKNIILDYKIKDVITSTSSGGITMYLTTGGSIGVDVGLHDITYGVRPYDFTLEPVNGFTQERMLSDKLMAILSRKRFRRTKDLFDFYAITNLFDVDYKLLNDFVERRGNAEWENIPFSDTVLVEYEKAWRKLKLVSSITGNTLEKPDFNLCIARFNEFAFALKEQMGYTKWIAKERQWI